MHHLCHSGRNGLSQIFTRFCLSGNSNALAKGRLNLKESEELVGSWPCWQSGLESRH